MKKVFFAVTFFAGLATIQAQSSAQFTLTPEGFSDYVVTDVPGKSQADLYKKTIEWISTAVKHPTEKIVSKTENQKIVFEGTDKIVSLNGAMKLSYESRYQIEVSFKEGKYKFDLLKLEYNTPRTAHGPGGWRDFELTDVGVYFTKQGELRPANKFHSEIPEYFNNLNNDLKRYIESGAKLPEKKSDW